MIKIFLFVVFIIQVHSVLFTCAYEDFPSDDTSNQLDDQEQTETGYNLFSDAVNQFTLKLYKNSANKEENYFTSPYSIWFALSLCYVGAGGETKMQLGELLNIDSSQIVEVFDQAHAHVHAKKGFKSDSTALEIANKIYLRSEFQPKDSYVRAVAELEVELESINFNKNAVAAKKINQWVGNVTHNKINQLISSDAINKDTQMILINALYFKGSWLNKFDAANTKKENFKLSNRKNKNRENFVPVDMMSLQREDLKCVVNPKNLPASVCVLPYVEENVSMTIVLPDKNSSLRDVQNKLDKETLKYILTEEMAQYKVNLRLPRFKLEYRAELKDTLKNLGAKLPFENGADFSLISDNLHISNIVHKALVEVNEEGTEAAAATEAEVEFRSAIIEQNLEFHCDRPFMFFIHDTINKNILFIGRYIMP